MGDFLDETGATGACGEKPMGETAGQRIAVEIVARHTDITKFPVVSDQIIRTYRTHLEQDIAAAIDEAITQAISGIGKRLQETVRQRDAEREVRRQYEDELIALRNPPQECAECKAAVGELHRPSCCRQGLVTFASVYPKSSLGTPGAIIGALFDFAEKECGHDPLSAHALTSVMEWVESAKKKLTTDTVAEIVDAITRGEWDKVPVGIAMKVREKIDTAREEGARDAIGNIPHRPELNQDGLLGCICLPCVRAREQRIKDASPFMAEMLTLKRQLAAKDAEIDRMAKERHAATLISNDKLESAWADAAALRSAIQSYLDTHEGNADRVANGEGRDAALALEAAHEELQAALASNAGADLLARLRAAEERAGHWKADLDRIAQAVYPHRQDRFTYSTDLMIEEIARLRAAEQRADQAETNAEAYRGAARLVQISAAIGEDELRKQLATAESYLANLLAVIHRDGGQYVARHGLTKAVEEAMALSANRIDAEEKAAALEDDVTILRKYAESNSNPSWVEFHLDEQRATIQAARAKEPSDV